MMFTPVTVALSGPPEEAGLMKCVEGKTYVSVYSDSAALVAKTPYAINFTSTAHKQVDAKTPVALATASVLIGVPEVAIAENAFGWLQIKGEAEVLVGATVVAADYLEVVANAAAVFTTEGATTLTASSCAVAVDAITGAGTITAYLFGKCVAIQAS
jgi:hypothetical protein